MTKFFVCHSMTPTFTLILTKSLILLKFEKDKDAKGYVIA